jgi:hypothetical protein
LGVFIPPRTPLDFAILIEEVMPEIEGAQDDDPQLCAECGDIRDDSYCASCDLETDE